MSQEKRNDEIDLVDLFFKGVIVVQKNFWLILSFFVVGSLLGLAYFYSAKKVYESQMIISSDILTESYAKILFDISNKHIRQGNIAGLGEQLHIDNAVASQVTSLSIARVAQADLKESERFIITARVLDQQVLPALQQGISQTLSDNDFVAIRVAQRKRALQENISATELEIKDLKQFKENLYKGDFFERNRGNVVFDPTVVNSKILELVEKKVKLENELALANSVQVVQGFTRFQRHVSPRLSVSLAAGAGVGLLFVGLLIAFKSIRRILLVASSRQA